jgi:recombinational DNA repair protein (RecF pathway)
MSTDELSTCAECGMSVVPQEYHPYAACLMFKQCQDGAIVRFNLNAVLQDGKTLVTARRVS